MDGNEIPNINLKLGYVSDRWNDLRIIESVNLLKIPAITQSWAVLGNV